MSHRVSILFAAGLIGIVTPMACGQVVRTSAGSVEFLGLEKWTPTEIQQRLGYSSSERLHYCAADLKKLGFPEVSVIGYSDHEGRHTVVTVVEPQHSAEIAYKASPSRHLSLPPEFEKLKTITKQPGFLEGGILDYGRTLEGALTKRPWLAEGTEQAWWPTARNFQKASDFTLAKQILDESGDPDARAVAAIVLMNFASRDASWLALVSGLRDPDTLVQATCIEAGNSLATFHPRRVDWAPATLDLVKLLHGTDLFAFQFLLKALTETKIEPVLARPLLGQGGSRLVIAYLLAQHDEERDLARNFLIQIRGTDLGNDPKAWEDWLAKL